MAKYDAQRRNPVRYAEAMSKQAELRRRYEGLLTRELLCDFCNHTIAIYLKGSHGPTLLKCPKCGGTNLVEPISFRLSLSTTER